MIVAHQLPQTEQNAICHLFSASTEQVRYAATHYCQRSPRTSTMLMDLLKKYREEGLAMPNIVEEYCREVRQRLLQELTPQEREHLLAQLTPKEREQLVKQLTLEERLRGLRPEEIQRYLQTIEEPAPAPPASDGNGSKTTET